MGFSILICAHDHLSCWWASLSRAWLCYLSTLTLYTYLHWWDIPESSTEVTILTLLYEKCCCPFIIFVSLCRTGFSLLMILFEEPWTWLIYLTKVEGKYHVPQPACSVLPRSCWHSFALNCWFPVNLICIRPPVPSLQSLQPVQNPACTCPWYCFSAGLGLCTLLNFVRVLWPKFSRLPRTFWHISLASQFCTVWRLGEGIPVSQSCMTISNGSGSGMNP